MSAEPEPLSRIFTVKNEIEWQENFVMQDSLGFLDCMDFGDKNRGIAFGDTVRRLPVHFTYVRRRKDLGSSSG